MRSKLFYCILSLLFVISDAKAEPYTIENVPNPKKYDAENFLANPDGILSTDAAQNINNHLKQLYETTGVELAIVVLNEIENDDENSFAYELFNYWRIGNKENNSGILILFVKNIRAVKIETGVGVEGLLPDAKCSDILNNDIFPAFRNGEYETGFLQAIGTIQSTLTSTEAKEELLLRQNSPSVKGINYLSYYLISGFFLLIVFCWITFYLTNSKEARNVVYLRLKYLRQILIFVSIFFPLHLIILTKWVSKKRKSVRYTPCICPKCNTAMDLLSEDTEDFYLNEYQTQEERIKSVDYDVWLCPNCSHYDIFSYKNTLSPYTQCPSCKSKAYIQKEERILKYPTTVATGTGERVYYCEACKQQHSKLFVIPKRPASGGVIIGGGGGSFGSSGGSWGGGFSGGGGAGGRF